MVVTFDFEANTKNKGNPFTASGKSITYAVKADDGEVESSYFTDIEYVKLLRAYIGKAKLLVGFNIKYDLHWARRHGVQVIPGTRVWDCQIAEFLLRGQQGAYPSLNEALTRFNLGQKDDKVSQYWSLGVDTEFIPVDELRHYNVLDVELTYKLYLEQYKALSAKLRRLCFLQGADLLVLADMEWNGVKLNLELCNERASEVKAALDETSSSLNQFLPEGAPFNWDSGHHLSALLYGGAFQVDVPLRTEQLVYKSGKRVGETYTKTTWETRVFRFERLFTPLKRTETKLVSKVGGSEYPVFSSGTEVLQQLRTPSKKHRLLIDLLLRRSELEKLHSTYYAAMPALLETMEWGDVLHGQYNQVVAATGRLSSSNPNMQNFSGEADELLVSRYAS